MFARRGGPSREEELCSGPGKLTQALWIWLDLDACDLARGPVRILAPARSWQEPHILEGTRVGITRAVELSWRFAVAGERNVSRPRPRVMIS